jgi:hypothetical protein
MRRAEAGSVFIETMIAAAIVMLLLAVMYRSIADSSARHEGLESRRTAMLIARSRMDAVGTEIPASPGRAAGSDGAYGWRADIRPYPAVAGTPLAVVVVSVQDRKTGATLASLTTLKILGQG